MGGHEIFSKLAGKFSGQNAYDTFIGRKVGRYCGEFLDRLGEEAISKMVSEDIDIDQSVLIQLGRMFAPYAKIANELEPDWVYSWVPDNNKFFLEALHNGRQWFIRQLANIKAILSS